MSPKIFPLVQLLEKYIKPKIPRYVIKNETKNSLFGISLSIKKDNIATKIGAEFTIIVAFEMLVIVILQCHRIKSVENAKEARNDNIITFLFVTEK